MVFDTNFDFEKFKQLLPEIINNKPSRDVCQKCILELILEIEKLSNEEDKREIELINKVIESIQIYLDVASI